MRVDESSGIEDTLPEGVAQITIRHARAIANRARSHTGNLRGALVQRADGNRIQKYEGATQIILKTKELRKKQLRRY